MFYERNYKITLSSNDDKRIQSIDSAETYAYWSWKDLTDKKEEIKCDNIITTQKWWTLIISQKRKEKKIMLIDREFLIISI